MADQGAIAKQPGATYSTYVALRAPLIAGSGLAVWADSRLASTRVALRAPAFLFRGATILVGVQDRLWGGGRDDTEGSPASPSLRVAGGGVFRFRIPIDSGQRSISVKCKETSSLVPRPVRDWAYDLVARHRRRIIKPSASCLMPTPEQRARFRDQDSLSRIP